MIQSDVCVTEYVMMPQTETNYSLSCWRFLQYLKHANFPKMYVPKKKIFRNWRYMSLVFWAYIFISITRTKLGITKRKETIER